MIRRIMLLVIIASVVAVTALYTLRQNLPIGPIILALALAPIAGLFMAKRSFKSCLPDLVFGAIDTGLLVVPALWGGLKFGVGGAIAGGVVGDALTDGFAGFFEGTIAK